MTNGCDPRGFGVAGNNAPDPLLAPLVLDSPDLLDGVGIKKHVRSA